MAKTNTGTCNVLTLNFVGKDWHEFLIRNQVHHICSRMQHCQQHGAVNDIITMMIKQVDTFFSYNVTTILMMYEYKHSEAYTVKIPLL